MNKWKDKKNYKTDEIEESRLVAGRFRLTVHRYVGRGDVWFASCPYLFDTRELASKDIKLAKAQAKAGLQVILMDALKDLEEKE